MPEIHKTGNKMRLVISGYTSPFYKIAQWVVDEFSLMPEQPGCYVKNVYEFVDQVKNIKLGPDEILASFDVKSL